MLRARARETARAHQARFAAAKAAGAFRARRSHSSARRKPSPRSTERLNAGGLARTGRHASPRRARLFRPGLYLTPHPISSHHFVDDHKMTTVYRPRPTPTPAPPEMPSATLAWLKGSRMTGISLRVPTNFRQRATGRSGSISPAAAQARPAPVSSGCVARSSQGRGASL